MGKDKRNLIDQLCTQAGMIMEDSSAAAISSRDVEEYDLTEYLNQIAANASKILALIAAAQALMNN